MSEPNLNKPQQQPKGTDDSKKLLKNPLKHISWRQTARMRNVFLSLVLLSIVSVGTVLGYFAIINNQKTYLHNRNFRILDQIAKNIDLRNESYARTASNIDREEYSSVVDSQEYRLVDFRDKYAPAFQIDTFPPYKLSSQTVFSHRGEWHIKYQTLPYAPPLMLTSPSSAANKLQEIDTQAEYSTPYQIGVSVKAEDFFDDLWRKDVYDCFFVFTLDSPQDDSALVGVDSENAKLIYESKEGSYVADFLARYASQDSFLTNQLDEKSRHQIQDLPYIFYFKNITFQQNEWILCGMIEENHFEANLRKISPLVVIILSLLILLFLLFLPILKLKLLSKNERLKVSDVFYSLIAAVLNTAIVTIIIFDLYYVFDDQYRTKRQLTELSYSIEKNFWQECDSILQQLSLADQWVGKVDLNPAKCSNVSILNQLPDSLISYPFFKSIYWANESGEILQEWTTDSDSTYLGTINISNREYFQRIRNNRAWEIPYRLKCDTVKSFFLESLLTLNTGENLADIAIPSGRLIPSACDNEGGNKASIVFLTTQLYSLMSPVLPQGFGYCVIDPKGEVLFHYNKNKNLQENFFDESTSQALKSAIQVRVPKFTKGKYLGKEHRFFVQPLAELPLYLVTFYDQSHHRTFHEQVFSFTLIFFLLTFLISVILTSLIVLRGSVSETHSTYNTQVRGKFIFDWLRPKDSFKLKYFYMACTNIIILGLTIGFTNTYKVQAVQVIFYISLSYIFAFLNAFIRLSVNYYGKPEIKENILIILSVVILWLIILFFTTILPQDDFVALLIFQGLLLLTAVLFPICYNFIKRQYQRLRNRVSVSGKITQSAIFTTAKGFNDVVSQFSSYLTPDSYRFFLLTWLSVISIFPVIKLYQISYNRERILQTKYSQVTFLQQLWERKQRVESEYAYLSEENSQYPRSGYDCNLKDLIFSHGIYGNAIHEIDTLDRFCNPPPTERSSDVPQDTLTSSTAYSVPASGPTSTLRYLDSMLYSLRPPYDPMVESLGLLFHTTSPDSFYNWYIDRKIRKPYVRFKEVLSRFRTEDSAYQSIILTNRRQIPSGEGRDIVIISKLFNFKWPSISFFNNRNFKWLFWLIFLLAMVVFYTIIKFTVNRITGQSILRLPIYNPPEVDNPGAVRTLLKKTKEHIFLLIPPRTIEEDYKNLLMDRVEVLKLEELEKNSLFLDMREIMESDSNSWLQSIKQSPHKIVALDYFEIYSEPSIQKPGKYKILESLLNCGKTIFIISTQEPLEMEEIFNWSERLQSNARKELTPVEQENYRWSQLLRGFTKVYYPLQKCQLCYSEKETIDFMAGGETALIVPFADQTSYEYAVDKTPLEQIYKNQLKNIPQEELPKRSVGKVIYLFTDYIHSSAYQEGERKANNLKSLKDYLHGVLKALEQEIPEKTDEVVNVSLVTNLAPVAILQMYTEHLIPFYSNSDLSVADKEPILTKLERDYHKWRIYLDRFRKAVLVVDQHHVQHKHELIRNRVQRECIHGNFMQGIQEDLIAQHIKSERWQDQFVGLSRSSGGDVTKPTHKDLQRIAEKITEETEIRAELYYHALWSSCSIEEKYLIYDLAEDGLINARNRDGIASLIRKGIFIKQDSRLRIFNKSFRNFVLTVIKPQDALQFEARLHRAGTWNWARIPISIILLAIAAFLLFTQQDIINQSVAFVGAIAAILPTFRGLYKGINLLQDGVTKTSKLLK